MLDHKQDRLIDSHELRKLVPYSLVHIGRLERAGKFPKRIRIGANRVAWSLNAVLAWIDARKAESSAAAEVSPVSERATGGAV